MRLITLDPGLRCCGLAYFRKGKLVHAGCAVNPYTASTKIRDVPAWLGVAESCRELIYEWLRGSRATQIVYEMPTVYVDGYADPNDLMQLAGVLGAIAGMFPEVPWEGFLPAQWKGQLDKGVHHARIKEFFLSPHEVRKLEVDLGEINAGLQHNALDAVGLGLHYLKRDRS
ncbi:MAG: hypothetical protein ACF8MF_06670 [Phycisphaerales bacterium JB052]